MPDYRVLIVDTRTGAVLDDLPFESFSLNMTVDWNRHDSMTVNVPLTGTDPRRQRVTGLASEPWKRTLCLTRDGLAVWAGPLMTTGWDNSSITFGCGGLTQLLDARMIFLVTEHNLVMTSTARDAMVYLLGTAIDDPAPEYDLPLVIGSQTGSGPQMERSWYGRDLPTVYDSVKKITEEDGAPDLRLQAQLDTNQSQLTWVAMYGDPHLGVVDPKAAWDYPATITKLSGDLDGTSMMTRGYVLGDGQEDDRLIVDATNSLVDDGFPILERSDRSAVSTRDLSVVAALANSLVSAHSVQTESWSVDVDPNFPGLSGWELGDNAIFRVFEHWFLPDGEYTRRVTGVRLSHNSMSLETTGAIST